MVDMYVHMVNNSSYAILSTKTTGVWGGKTATGREKTFESYICDNKFVSRILERDRAVLQLENKKTNNGQFTK